MNAAPAVPTMSATYDPADNKLRLRSVHRLDAETYARIKAAGFSWAPKQELFVAPAWTPEREDIMLELCGEIDDEDTSLVDRAEQRAERFEGYGDKRAADAESARQAVDRIADGIPLGQPILVGHHSERHARKDAERIESGMRKSVRLWETSKYWERRASAAKRHAKYKENPAVRHRRIKGLESDLRRHTKERDTSLSFLKLWQADGLTAERARSIANVDRGADFGSWTKLEQALASGESLLEVVADVKTAAIASHERRIAWAERWLAHLHHRLAYERAMLDEAGGLPASRFEFQVGGRVQVRDGWFVVKSVNRSDGEIRSVSLFGTYLRGIETVIGYQAPTDADLVAVKKATKLPPIINLPGEGVLEMTAADWKRKVRHQSGTMRKHDATDAHGAYRARECFAPGGSFRTARVFLTDEKRVEMPKPAGAPVDASALAPVRAARTRAPKPAPAPTAFDEMKDALKSGVRVVTSPELFPTPEGVARRMIDAAGSLVGKRVLEPSSGTGNLVIAALRAGAREVHHMEVDAAVLGASSDRIGQVVGREAMTCCVCPVHGDFLLGSPSFFGSDGFDLVLMNPPFSADVEHIMHALGYLKSGGKLVAVCANGPRQERTLRPIASTWEPLPEGSFRASGTGVRTVLLTIEKA